jgi:hypothetical protein
LAMTRAVFRDNLDVILVFERLHDSAHKPCSN